MGSSFKIRLAGNIGLFELFSFLNAFFLLTLSSFWNNMCGWDNDQGVFSIDVLLDLYVLVPTNTSHIILLMQKCDLCRSQEHHIQTGQGSVSVIVCGDQDKPPLITYPDLALNRKCLEIGIIFFLFWLWWRYFRYPGACYFSHHQNMWNIFWVVYFHWNSCRHVMFSRIILFPRSSFVATSQLLHLPYQSPRTWGLYYCWVVYMIFCVCFGILYSHSFLFWNFTKSSCS